MGHLEFICASQQIPVMHTGRSFMKEAKNISPLLRLPPSIFMVGQDAHGHWVASDLSGARGGLFANRTAALRYVRLENGNYPSPTIMVSGVLQLDMNGSRKLHLSQEPNQAIKRDLRVA